MSLIKKLFPELINYRIYIKYLLYSGVLLYTGLNYVHYHNQLLAMEYMFQTTPYYEMSVYQYHKIFYPAIQYLIMFVGTLVMMINEKEDFNFL